MAKRKTPEAVPATDAADKGRRHVRGPFGPGVPETTVYAAFEAGAVVDTPKDMVAKGRGSSILVTDDPTAASRFAHGQIIVVGEKGPKAALLEAHFAARRLDHDARTITVAGSAVLNESAFGDAWKVVAKAKTDEDAPYSISHWKSSRTKGSDLLTLTRD
jgi:hypothetical protein